MSKSTTDSRISRRGFLKTAGTVTALATVGNTLFGKSVSPILKEAPSRWLPMAANGSTPGAVSVHLRPVGR